MSTLSVPSKRLRDIKKDTTKKAQESTTVQTLTAVQGMGRPHSTTCNGAFRLIGEIARLVEDDT